MEALARLEAAQAASAQESPTVEQVDLGCDHRCETRS
jgi:hypothetical protein